MPTQPESMNAYQHRTLLVSDIFGRTPALETLAAKLPGSTDIIDPYLAKHMHFDDEQAAYHHFVDHVGLSRYTQMLEARVTSDEVSVQLLGFSVGASACWRLIGQHKRLSQSKVRQAICFYGSQIRHHSELEPAVDTILVLPRSENSFDVAELSEKLAHKAQIKLQQSPYLHGYMSPHSDNFDGEGYAETLDWLHRQLSTS